MVGNDLWPSYWFTPPRRTSPKTSTLAAWENRENHFPSPKSRPALLVGSKNDKLGARQLPTFFSTVRDTDMIYDRRGNKLRDNSRAHGHKVYAGCFLGAGKTQKVVLCSADWSGFIQ